jgi:FMN phosphatase YigB (HAD superfamily)
MPLRVVLFDVGGPLDMEFAWEIAVDGAIASACGLEGIRVDPAMVEEASEAAVAAFALDAYVHMVETLCGGDPDTAQRVTRRMRAMVGNLDVFQLRPEIDGLLWRLRERGLRLGIVANQPTVARGRLARVGIGDLFDDFVSMVDMPSLPAHDCIMVGDRLDTDIAPAKARGMATILFRSGRYRRQRPRSAAEDPDAVVTDVPELEAAISTLLSSRA